MVEDIFAAPWGDFFGVVVDELGVSWIVAEHEQLQLMLERLFREAKPHGEPPLVPRLIDGLLGLILRAWQQSCSRDERAQLEAYDTRIARALNAIYETPHENWTVASLAQLAGMSRAAFARRFCEQVGPAEFRRNLQQSVVTAMG